MKADETESKSYQMQAEEYLEHIKCLEAKIERLNGVIEGLKFAVRCNGVSGGRRNEENEMPV